MKRTGVGGFSVVCRTARAPRASMSVGSGAPVGMERHYLLELQWQGRGGRFRHLAVSQRGLRRALGRVSVVALFALGVAGALSVWSNRAPVPLDIATVVRENMDLKTRQESLREQAFDLADQLYRCIEQGRRLARLADAPPSTWLGPCPLPPTPQAGDEAILAWLSEQTTRLEAIGNELTAGRVEMGVKRALASAGASMDSAPVPGAAGLQMADLGSAARPAVAPVGR